MTLRKCAVSARLGLVEPLPVWWLSILVIVLAKIGTTEYISSDSLLSAWTRGLPPCLGSELTFRSPGLSGCYSSNSCETLETKSWSISFCCELSCRKLSFSLGIGSELNWDMIWLSFLSFLIGVLGSNWTLLVFSLICELFRLVSKLGVDEPDFTQLFLLTLPLWFLNSSVWPFMI